MTRTAGQRVGVVLGSAPESKIIRMVGFGVYEGDEIPPGDVGGFNVGIPNPKLVMDDGQVCWGCEVWWGGESSVKAHIKKWKAAGYSIVFVNMDEERAAARGVG